MRSRRGALRLALAACALPGAAAGQVAACEGAAPFPQTIRLLEADGWTVHPPGAPLPPEAVDRLAWALALEYLGGGDRGGETPEAVVALQRRAVPGLARKVDTDATRSRVLLSADGAMILTETALRADAVERTCRIASDGRVDGAGETEADLPDGAPATLLSTQVVVETFR